MYLIIVLVFINMNYLIMMWKVGRKNCIKASDVKLITFLIRWRDDYNILVSSYEYSPEGIRLTIPGANRFN